MIYGIEFNVYDKNNKCIYYISIQSFLYESMNNIKYAYITTGLQLFDSYVEEFLLDFISSEIFEQIDEHDVKQI